MRRPVAIAFLGPSLPVAEARRLFPGADLRGPARQGDVLKALRARPRAIALVDGVFESQPSVWHQELRVALSEGVHVVGAASMGALRAVELAPFGMLGVGAVYRAYAAGRLVDDADVALLHAGAEHGWRPLTVPLVNVLATADHALETGALKLEEARQLLQAARQLHYHDRRWPAISLRLPWPARTVARFERHRAAHPQDVKAADARECLVVTRRLCAKARPAPPPLTGLSVWARRGWLAAQGTPPPGDADAGLRSALVASWARSIGLLPPPERVAFFERQGARLGLDAGLLRRSAEALALEEAALAHPALLLPQAPSRDEGAWVDALRRAARRGR